ncbi:MAG TPA: NusG domain II-containing protein [Exilispira sp.]|nr:NusG domain II-containing protein [Exilispira sp.]
MKKIAKSFFRKGDLIIYFLVILITILPFLLPELTIKSNPDNLDLNKTYVEIDYNGNKYSYSLSENQTITLKNGLIIVEIKDKKVRVKQSDCPDKICVKRGWIEKPGQFIICMPNKLIVKIVGNEQYDSITY